jgi:hypothetical protein
MANLLQSNQQTTTSAPDYYNNYLSGIASKGQTAVDNAQYVGAQPLQTKAFTDINTSAGSTQPQFQQGQNLADQSGAAASNITGAASNYLQAGTSNSPLSTLQPFAQSAMANTGAQAGQPLIGQGASISGLDAANPYLLHAAGNDVGQMAQQYMNPYLQNQIQSTSDLAQRNIQQNLDPMATAAAVGSGQFGSQRGAQVLGQVNEQAQQDLNNTIANMQGSAYGQALTAAGQQQNLLGQLGSTAGNLANTQASNLITGGTNLGNLQQGANTTAANLGATASNAQQAQNQANLTAGQTAGNLATSQANALNQAGLAKGTLASQAGTQNLADINAESTLGGQQQTIEQNKQLFPLNNLSTLSGMLRGYNVPTTTTTTANGSPLSALASVGAGGAALFQGTGTDGKGPSLYNQMFGGNGVTNGALSGAGNLLKSGYNAVTGGPNGSPASGVTTSSGDSAFKDNNSPTGYADGNGNPLNADGSPYIAANPTTGGLDYNNIDTGTGENNFD